MVYFLILFAQTVAAATATNAATIATMITDEYSGVGVGVTDGLGDTPGAANELLVGTKNAWIAISLAGTVTLTVLEV